MEGILSGIWWQELKQRPWRDAAYWSAPDILRFYTSQKYQPRIGITHGMSFPMTIIRRKRLKDWSTGQFYVKGIFLTKVPSSQKTRTCVKLTKS